MKIKSVTTFLMTLLVATTLSAGDSIGSFQFLKLPAHAVDSGLAGASSTLAGGSETLFINPANLAEVKNMAVSASYNAWILEMAYFSASASFPVGDGTLALGGSMLSTGKQEIIENFKVTGDQANANISVSVAYGIDIMKNFAVGAGIRYTTESLFEERIQTLLLDVSSTVKLDNRIRGAVVVRNLGNSETSLPLNIRVAGSYTYSMSVFQFTPILQFDYNIDTAEAVTLAVTGGYKGILNLRLGYNYKLDHSGMIMNDGIRLGVGVKVHGITCDLAYTPMGELGQTVMVSMGFRK